MEAARPFETEPTTAAKSPASGSESVEEAHDTAARMTIDDLVLDRALAKDDPDRFERESVAARLADLVSVAEPPLNVGLFGPWGSGKSSMEELIGRALAEREREPGAVRVKLIHYDAWKYGGHSLRRNFISNAATALGLGIQDAAAERFHRGLYEKRRRAVIDTGQLARALWGIAPRFIFIYSIFVLLFSLVVGAASVLTAENFMGEVQRTIPKALAGSGVVAFLLAVLKTVFDTGRVDIEQAQPSEEEEFTETFRGLIELARPSASAKPTPTGGWRRHAIRARRLAEKVGSSLLDAGERKWLGLSGEQQREAKEQARPTYDRFVFFIDELDRCDEKDVVATLVAIRTFLDEDHCVFVVAADRAVLERALERKVEQATPIVADAPYYSTAGAFIDKVFQHQLTLPPLRTRRLTVFARDLVINREAGLWAELREQKLLNPVLTVLIPFHVRSPRRVKVLLNNFATRARIAQSRRPRDWPARAPEIAKLTALQTEYPRFAAALLQEPRLPRLLLEANQTGDAQATEDLLDRYEANEVDAYLPDPDEGQQEARWTEMKELHRQQLVRYLQVASRAEDPRSDLLYLEAPGELFGLVDPVLGELIEHDAPDFPARVKVEIEKQDLATRGQAVRLLADLVPNTVGDERTNVMSLILPACEDLYGEAVPDDVWRAAATSVRIYASEEAFDPSALVSVLKIGLGSGDGSIVRDVMADPNLLVENERVIEVGKLLDVLPPAHWQQVVDAIAARCGESPEVLTTPFGELPADTAVRLYQTDEVQGAVAVAVESGGPEAASLVNGLVDRALEDETDDE